MSAQLLAITDDGHICWSCGKKHLKRVAVLKLSNGDIVQYGRDCAARTLGKRIANDIDAMSAIIAYIVKWSAIRTPEQVLRGVWNVCGFSGELIDGKYVFRAFSIDIRNYFEVYSPSVTWWAA